MDRALPESDVLYTVDEVARNLWVSARWLAGPCRAERVEDVHLARARRSTRSQVELLVDSHTVVPRYMSGKTPAVERLLPDRGGNLSGAEMPASRHGNQQ